MADGKLSKLYSATRKEIRTFILSNYVSKSIREYYEQLHKELPDWTLASILFNIGPVEDMRAVFPQLAKVTDDQKLSFELKERIALIEKNIDLFRKNDGRFVYRLETREDYGNRGNFCVNGVFTDCRLAELVGKKTDGDFQIIKQLVLQNLDEVKRMCRDDGSIRDDEPGITFYRLYPSGHKLLSCQEDSVREVYGKDRFEYKFEGILHPFRYGDFVRAKDGTIGIVTYNKTDSEMLAEHDRIRQFADYTDELIRIDFMYDGNKCGWVHYRVYEAELVPESEVPEKTREECKWLLRKLEKEDN